LNAASHPAVKVTVILDEGLAHPVFTVTGLLVVIGIETLAVSPPSLVNVKVPDTPVPTWTLSNVACATKVNVLLCNPVPLVKKQLRFVKTFQAPSQLH